MNNGILVQDNNNDASLKSGTIFSGINRGISSSLFHITNGLPYNPDNLVLVFDTSKEPNNLQVSVPLNGSVNCTIDWGDGVLERHTSTGFKTHIYEKSGIYIVQISGTMTSLSYDTSASTTNNKQKLVGCLSFGKVGLVSLANGFRNCPNFIQVPDSLPTTSNVTSLQGTFFGCSLFNDVRITGWNTSTVTNLNGIFVNASIFNQNIGGWNTAAVTNMSSLFFACSFNQNIGGWNTSAVTTMLSAFDTASFFNQDISGWNTENVTNMSFMFTNAISFNQDISSWNTAKVTTMERMFTNARVFNQNIGNWNTSMVTNMSLMFSDILFNHAFAQDISNWDIRKVTTMATMFVVSNWGTSNYDAALQDWADLADTDLTIGTTTNTSQAITELATLSSGTQTRVTSNGHGLVAGSRVNISGTTNYNGDYNVLAATTNTFDIAQAFVANDATGTMKHRRSRNVTANFGTNKYNAGSAATARNVLVNTYGWTITDGGQV